MYTIAVKNRFTALHKETRNSTNNETARNHIPKMSKKEKAKEKSEWMTLELWKPGKKRKNSTNSTNRIYTKTKARN